MIEFVYFDLGNVLWKFDEDVACANTAKVFGVEPALIRDAVYGSGLQNRFEHGGVTPRGFVDELTRSLASTRKAVSEQVVLDSLSNMFVPIEEMVMAIDAVRQKGTKVGILSNTCHSHWDWIARQEHALMSSRFDAVVLSHEVNSMKPDDQIYRAAELACHTPVDRILFLDDKEENVLAAKRRGWRAECCVGGDSAVQMLIKHNVINESWSAGGSSS
ncbi:HAD family phosphatase [Rubripirellula amarantea]|nr:HAD family phosphatase [Rubripirellula amarantea]